MDEASPHLHFDYIPVATGYKTGLPIRNSLSKAMEPMGYVVENGASKKNNQTMLWKDAERKYFASICEEVGLEVKPEKSWGRNNLSVEEYKEAKMDRRCISLYLAEYMKYTPLVLCIRPCLLKRFCESCPSIRNNHPRFCYTLHKCYPSACMFIPTQIPSKYINLITAD